jgi:hypothetical protein
MPLLWSESFAIDANHDGIVWIMRQLKSLSGRDGGTLGTADELADGGCLVEAQRRPYLSRVTEQLGSA